MTTARTAGSRASSSAACSPSCTPSVNAFSLSGRLSVIVCTLPSRVTSTSDIAWTLLLPYAHRRGARTPRAGRHPLGGGAQAARAGAASAARPGARRVDARGAARRELPRAAVPGSPADPQPRLALARRRREARQLPRGPAHPADRGHGRARLLLPGAAPDAARHATAARAAVARARQPHARARGAAARRRRAHGARAGGAGLGRALRSPRGLPRQAAGRHAAGAARARLGVAAARAQWRTRPHPRARGGAGLEPATPDRPLPRPRRVCRPRPPPA